MFRARNLRATPASVALQRGTLVALLFCALTLFALPGGYSLGSGGGQRQLRVGADAPLFDPDVTPKNSKRAFERRFRECSDFDGPQPLAGPPSAALAVQLPALQPRPFKVLIAPLRHPTATEPYTARAPPRF